MKISRLLLAGIRGIFNFLKNHWLIFKYKVGIRPIQTNFQNIAHVLIVKNLAYVEISIYSILSFLFHNKNSKVIIHCDQICFEKIKEKYSTLISMGRVELKEGMEESCWQLSKLRIFKELPNETHCMFDVDTRWNGGLELESGVSYVSHFEFQFIEKSPWRWLIKNYLKIDEGEKFLMLNTSFIRKSDLVNGRNTFLDEIFEDIFNITDCNEIGKGDHPGVIRIAEQVAISIYLQHKSLSVKALVNDGRPRSGMLLETTYFGATGNKF
jgi:hypothetical protein